MDRGFDAGNGFLHVLGVRWCGFFLKKSPSFAIKRAKTMVYRKSGPAGLLFRLKDSYGAEGQTDGRADFCGPDGPSCRLTPKSERSRSPDLFFTKAIAHGKMAFWGGAWIGELMREMGSYKS